MADNILRSNKMLSPVFLPIQSLVRCLIDNLSSDNLKGLFGVGEFSQKKQIRGSSKHEFVCLFFGEFEDNRSPFEII